MNKKYFEFEEEFDTVTKVTRNKHNFYKQLEIELEVCNKHDLLSKDDLNHIHSILDTEISEMINENINKDIIEGLTNIISNKLQEARNKTLHY